MKLTIHHILICLLVYTTSAEKFDFFITENRVKTAYSKKHTQLLEIKFNYENTKTINDKIKLCLTNLRSPFKLKAADIEARDNPITLHISDLASWASKFDVLAKNLINLINSMTPFTTISSDRQIDIEIDNNYLTQKLSDIEATAKVITQTFKDQKTVAALIDSDVFFEAKMALQLLNNDVAELFYGYNTFYQMLTLMSQHYISDTLRLKLLDDGKPIKQNGYKFVEKGKIDSDPIFYVQAIYLLHPYKYKSLTSIPYNKISLENSYYVEYPSNIIKKTHSNPGLTSNKSLSECLGGLNGKLYDKILKDCIFVNNRQQYIESSKGLYLFDIPQSQIAKINDQFGLKIKKANLPNLLQFDGNLQLDLESGSTSFTKSNSDTTLLESNLPQETVLQIKTIFKPIKYQKEILKNFILKFLEEEYDVILVNFSILSILTAIFVIFKKSYYSYKNNKSKNRPINIELNKVARKRKSLPKSINTKSKRISKK